jgi:hypothetical protein
MTGRLTPFLVALARDPELYAAWIRQPEAVMVWVGLDAEDQAVLSSRDQNRIYQALFVTSATPPVAAAWPGAGVPAEVHAQYWGSYSYPPTVVNVPAVPPAGGSCSPCA